MTFLERFNSPKLDFTQNGSDGKIIKSQQSQTSTSHFESFWSIVNFQKNSVKIMKNKVQMTWKLSWIGIVALITSVGVRNGISGSSKTGKNGGKFRILTLF